MEVLEFHHIDEEEKKFTIGGAWRNYGLQSVIDEIAKCAVLCANDHLRVHAGTRDLPERE